MDPVTVYKAVRTADTVRRVVPWRAVAVGVATTGLAVAVVALLLVQALFFGGPTRGGAAPVAGAGCVTLASGTTVADLDPRQSAVATTIVAVAQARRLPQRAAIVALATASQESNFRMYANDGSDPRLRADQRGVSASLRYPHDAVGRDHGSVNYMQQQFPWWGTLDQLMDPRYPAEKFYDTLLTVPGWEALPVTVAAQRVQRSAFPTAYADDEALAVQLYAAITGTGGAVTTPVGFEQAVAGCTDTAVPAGFEALAGATAGQRVVNAAARWLGTPYSWGGGTVNGPSEGFAQGAGIVGFDCSGLVLHAWFAGAGVRLPHSSATISATTARVPASAVQAGDILSFASSPGGGRVTHDGLYDGRGGMIHAPHTGDVVKVSPGVLADPYWTARLVSITRPAGAAP